MERSSLSSSYLNQMFSDIKETWNGGNHGSTHHRLPNEILTLVISHLFKQKKTLYECALVSKQFHDIANSFLWKALDFDNNATVGFFTGLSTISTQRLAILANPIRQICFTSRIRTETQVNRLLPHMPHLEHLKINIAPPFANENFEDVPQNYRSSFSLTVTLPYMTHISFFTLAHHCRQLCTLECDSWSNFSSLAQLTACPLERLTFRSFHSLTTNDTAALHAFDLVCLNLEVPAVERLMTSRAWPRLTSLTLSSCKCMKDTIFIRFFKSHPHLTYLDLKHPHQLTQTTLDAMTRWLPHLASVTIYDNGCLSNDAVRRWVQRNPSLTCAKFSYCRFIFPDAFPESQQNDDSLVHLDQCAIEKIKSTTP